MQDEKVAFTFQLGRGFKRHTGALRTDPHNVSVSPVMFLSVKGAFSLHLCHRSMALGADSEALLNLSKRPESKEFKGYAFSIVEVCFCFCNGIYFTNYPASFFQFWDYRQPRKYLNILPCQVPVWKARYTVSELPFLSLGNIISVFRT